MAEQHLATYLNDHLAGSEVGIELLEHLEQSCAGTPEAALAAELRAEITADRRELEALMGQLGVAVSRTRAVAGWLAEKGARLKLKVDDPAGGALRRLEVFEAVSLGVEGKRLLWRSLAAALPGAADYGRLEQRAEEQRRRLEAARLAAARSALGPAPGGA